jgi:hypothetical protein
MHRVAAKWLQSDRLTREAVQALPVRITRLGHLFNCCSPGGEILRAGHGDGLNPVQYLRLALAICSLVPVRPVLDVAVEALEKGPAVLLRGRRLAY